MPGPGARVQLGRLLQHLFRQGSRAGDNDIARVEVSFGEGRTWQRAELNPSADKYAWRTFSYAYTPRRPGYTTVLARATDDAGNVQPVVSAWNPLGYFWNGWHRVGFVVSG